MEVILLDLIYDRNVTRAEVQRLSIYIRHFHCLKSTMRDVSYPQSLKRKCNSDNND